LTESFSARALSEEIRAVLEALFTLECIFPSKRTKTVDTRRMILRIVTTLQLRLPMESLRTGSYALVATSTPVDLTPADT
jgi:hypothetical protein